MEYFRQWKASFTNAINNFQLVFFCTLAAYIIFASTILGLSIWKTQHTCAGSYKFVCDTSYGCNWCEQGGFCVEIYSCSQPYYVNGSGTNEDELDRIECSGCEECYSPSALPCIDARGAEFNRSLLLGANIAVIVLIGIGLLLLPTAARIRAKNRGQSQIEENRTEEDIRELDVHIAAVTSLIILCFMVWIIGTFQELAFGGDVGSVVLLGFILVGDIAAELWSPEEFIETNLNKRAIYLISIVGLIAALPAFLGVLFFESRHVLKALAALTVLAVIIEATIELYPKWNKIALGVYFVFAFGASIAVFIADFFDHHLAEVLHILLIIFILCIHLGHLYYSKASKLIVCGGSTEDGPAEMPTENN